MAELLSNEEAVAHGLSVMATRMLFEQLPRYLAEIVGEKQASVLLARFAEEAAEAGFREFAARVGMREPPPLHHLLTIFLAPPRGKEKVHPFQVVERLETSEGKVVLRLAGRRWNLVEASMFAGVVAGVLTAAGYVTKPLTEESAARHLCGEGAPSYIAYPRREGETWMIVVEPLSC